MAFTEFDNMPQSVSLNRRSLLRGTAFLSASAALAGMPMGRAAFAKMDGTIWKSVTAAVNEYVDEGKVANMVATLGWGQDDYELINRGTLQLGGMKQADGDTLYRIYSMTKPITGIATMILIDDGKLTLDTPLADILPAFANMKVQKEYDGAITEDNLEPAVRPITIRHLLTHTAGLGYNIVQKGPIQKAYNDAELSPGQVSRMKIPGVSDQTTIKGLAAFADKLAEMPLVYQPGTTWSYSVSLDLMGRVIEVVSGMPFDQFLSKHLFEPCGMDSTYFQVPQAQVARFATNYGILGGNLLPLDPAAASIYLDEPAFPFGGAGLVCSPNDYDKFQRMLVGLGEIDGNRVMSERAVRVGTSNMLPETAITKGTWVEGQLFGAGGRVTGTAFGWGGAAGTAAFADIKSGLRAAMFTQYMPSTEYSIQQDFPKLVLKDLAAMPTAPVKEAAEAAAELVDG
ncbi:serine hydrolase domain-containing protein [Pontixanthobacter aestiaquae]|uniref:Serine hydrolase n=1 Tax=Pontixanthobacter aestiaquae TaxID=1509367 RepID=A0A844Z8A7_9SPHN|nr:serine hydrolase domain-containing protein [Pontixanthobacter aestiaquae]MDN3644951.1 serine hydrolase domain-containing protein [Pontixanthobacter aestiaquae]MXO84048.1 serine hydrolase [Pontixanthobacter aestiaquae]